LLRISTTILFLCFAILSSCAGEKEEKKSQESGSSAGAAPTDILVPPKDMVPSTIPLPVVTGPKNPPEEPKPAPAPSDPWKESLLVAQRRAQNVRINCTDGTCNPSVGLVSLVSKQNSGWEVGQCTGSLVASDIVVTNGHCIPMDLNEPGADCSGRLWISFANESGLDSQIACSKVLLRKKDGGFDGSDYAFFQLEKRSNRPVLRHSRAGIEHGEQYSVHKVNPVRLGSEAIGGQMEKVTCRAVGDSVIFDQVLNKQSHSYLFGDCQIVRGNSGAPILGKDGTMHGVIYSVVDPIKARKMLERNGSSMPPVDQMSPLSVGSNFACLQDPATIGGRPLPKDCEGHAERLLEAKKAKEEALTGKLKAQAQRLIEENHRNLLSIQSFGWTVRTTSTPNTGRMAFGLPDCFQAKIGSSLLDQKTNIYRPFFYIKAKYSKYAQPSEEALIWGGFVDTVESLYLSPESRGYRVKITDPANSQLELNTIIGSCN
jgi:V8-like Glu-specific endopeptidase